MMVAKLRTGLIGCGKVGHTHAQALSMLPESDFRGVCDRARARAHEFAGQYGVKAYTNVTDMVNREKLDAVIVCTPHPVHARPTIEAIAAGAHVLVEKPMASNLADCDVMLVAAQEHNVTLAVVSQRRFYVPVQRVKAAIDTGKIGRPILGVVTLLGWRDETYYRSDPWRGTWQGEGGGVLVNQAVHQLDLLLWFMGPVAELTGYWANLNHPYIEVEDTAVAVLRFTSGALGTITVSNSQNPGLYGRIHVFGENGASVGVQTDGGSMFIAGMSSVADPPINDLWTIPDEKHLLEDWQRQDHDTFAQLDTATFYHRLQIQNFLQSIIDGEPPLIDGVEGRRAVELFSAIYRSQEQQSCIHFPL